MSIISIDELNIGNLLFAFEDSLIETGRVYRDIRTSIIVKLNDDILFQYDTPHGNIQTNDSYQRELNEVFKIAGLNDLYFEFSPSNYMDWRSNDRSFIFQDGNVIPKKIETFVDYKEWFQRIFSRYTQVFLVPDTNFLLNCYYSNYLKEIIQKNSNASISLSRLTLFEIERIINALSSEIRADEDKLEKGKIKQDIESFKNFIEDKKRQKRLGFQAVSEIGSIIRDGATLIPYNESLLRLFPVASGSSFADSWIRMEIGEYGRTIRVKGGDVIFLTSDLLNSLMSVAENINTTYIHNTKKIRDRKRDINNLVYSTCVLFEKCTIIMKSSLSSKEKKFHLNSVWEGKSTEEWASRKVIYDPL